MVRAKRLGKGTSLLSSCKRQVEMGSSPILMMRAGRSSILSPNVCRTLGFGRKTHRFVIKREQADLLHQNWRRAPLKVDTLAAARPKRSVYIPAAGHPWRRFRIKSDHSNMRAPGDISIRG